MEERADISSSLSIPRTLTRLYSVNFSLCISKMLSLLCSCSISRLSCSSCNAPSIPVISSDAILRIVSREFFSSFISLPLLQPAIYPKEYSEVSIPKCWHTVNATLSASTSFVFLSFAGTSMLWLTSLSCSMEWATSCTIVFKVWLSLIFFCTAILFSTVSKYPLESPGISSKLTGTGKTFMSACTKSSYPSTVDKSSCASNSGIGLPSVWDTSKTDTARKAGIVTSVSSFCGIPFSSNIISPVTGSNLSLSSLILYGAGARIRIAFSPLLTWRSKFFCHALYPATSVASGFCKAISRVLLKL